MLQSATIVRELEGVSTDVLLQSFSDRILVLVTQLGKVGSLVSISLNYDDLSLTETQTQATIPSTMPLLPPPPPDPSQPNVVPLPIPPPSLQLTPLLGSAPSERIQTLHSLYTSQIATLVWTMEGADLLEVDRRPVVVGLALAKTAGPANSSELTPQDRKVFYGVMEMVRELLARK